MFRPKIPSWDQLTNAKPKLVGLNLCGEYGVWIIWKSEDEDDLEFEDGKAVMEYNYNITLAQKMVFRRRTSPDMCYFWNSIDPGNRRVLLSAAGLLNVLEDLDFFVWLGNRHCEWNEGALLKTTIKTYYDADEETQKKWLLEFEETMSKY